MLLSALLFNSIMADCGECESDNVNEGIQDFYLPQNGLKIILKEGLDRMQLVLKDKVDIISETPFIIQKTNEKMVFFRLFFDQCPPFCK